MNYLLNLEKWLKSSVVSEDLKDELRRVSSSIELEDRFYKDLEFGTGGLRGLIGAGNNRMNVYTVAKVTQGYAQYLNKNFINPSIAIAYDSRNMSKEFAKAAALTFAAGGVKVYLFEDLRPTPELSFTVREFKCSGGIVITASHNPKEYNGYKVYGADGGQITDETANEIIGYINSLDIFNDTKTIDEKIAVEKGLLNYIGEEIDQAYIERVKNLVIRKELVEKEAGNLNIIYTPIHGSGNIPIRRVLKELGFTDVNVVKEQEMPDGNFGTAPYPNPEDKRVFNLALEMAKKTNPDIIFGTDPDCDRIGVVVKDVLGEYKVLTGNQTGMLLAEYMLRSLKDENKLSNKGVIVKTIVTTEAVRNIANSYGVQVIDTLTGFKYIGEKIAEFEEANSNEFIFGLEESYGYLAGTFVRDKDAVIASALIAEMTLYYKSKGLTLYEAMLNLYEKYGFSEEKLISIELKGRAGQEKISRCINNLRDNLIKEVNGIPVKAQFDYKLSKEINIKTLEEKEVKLPKSNVLKYILEDNSWFVIRPSGTEPKMKIYLAVEGNSLGNSKEKIESVEKAVMKIINNNL